LRSFFEAMQTKTAGYCVVCKMRKRDRRSRPERETKLMRKLHCCFLI